VHGANRLASNSLLECLVFGRRAAQAINNDQLTINNEVRGIRAGFGLDSGLRSRIRVICDSCAGVERTVSGLERGLKEIECVLSNVRNAETRECFETYNMALSARAVFTAALKRRESAGTHYLVKEGSAHV
jgi:L-aspartate oxidase